MIFWVMLFILVVLISFFLAMQSMRNFREVPQAQEEDYGLFLIRKTINITLDLLDQLHTLILKEGFIVSFERLFKGSESTLVLFAPRRIAQNYLDLLDLIEIEDYTDVPKEGILGFEMGTKESNYEAPRAYARGIFSSEDNNNKNLQNFFVNFPKLEDAETIWWQLIIMAKKDRFFEIVPRVVIRGRDLIRAAEIEKKLHHLAGGFLIKIPKPYSIGQILQFYQQRNFGKDMHNPTITSNEVLNLIRLPLL